MVTDMITGIMVYLQAEFKIVKQRSLIVWLLRKRSLITPEYSKVASRYNAWLPLSIITVSTWLDDRIGSLWGQCHRRQLYSISSTSPPKLINRQPANTDMYPYDGIRRGFLGLLWRFVFVAGILRIHGATGGWTGWALSGDQRIQHVFKVWRFNWGVVSPCGNGHYFVVRQSQLGEARSLFGCQSQSGVTSMWFAHWAYSYTWWQPRWIHCELEW